MPGGLTENDLMLCTFTYLWQHNSPPKAFFFPFMNELRDEQSQLSMVIELKTTET